jgi:hypothetical protein
MLHAINGRKAKLSAFRAAGQRVPMEDMITSTVFGPLAFLDNIEMSAVLDGFLTRLGVARPAWVGAQHLSLWPKHAEVPKDLRSSYIEPDLVISDQDGASLIIEVKWGAPLGTRELASQWLSLGEGRRMKSVHLLLVLEPHVYREHVASDTALVADRSDMAWPLFTRSWREAADAFRATSADGGLGPGTRRWAESVHSFLRREDPGALVGWPSLGLVPVPPVAWRASTSPFLDLAPLSSLAWRFTG